MSKFNNPTPGAKTTNLAGGQAYKQDAKLELASILLTSFVSDQYYRSADDTLDRVRELLDQLPDKQFAAKAAVYARTTYGMRSISHVIAGELAHRVKGERWTRPFYNQVVYRPDDATEILAYYASRFGKPIPNSLKDGLGQAPTRFDAYQLAKYRGEGKAVSLVDVVNLAHPQPTEALTALVNGTLKPAETWETKLTAAGKAAESDDEKEELKAAAWGELIASRKLGYFALLRNLRNISEQSPESLDAALAMLTDERLIRKSLVLPFRFFTAYQELRTANVPGKVLKAVSEALDLSLANMPKLPGETLVVVDHSGSMDNPMSDKSRATCFQVGGLLGAALAKAQDADFMYFGDIAKYYAINPADSTLSILDQIEKLNQGGGWGYTLTGTLVGHGTNFHAIFQTVNKAYNRIVMLSDMQGWVGYSTPSLDLAHYQQQYKTNPHVYSIDLTGYGSLQLPQERVYCLAGFSEKTLELMTKLEQDRNALVHEIEAIELGGAR